jgi:altronate hydrolase
MIANEFPPASLSDFPNVDGVVPICHGWGCGMAAAGEGFEALRDCITGYGSHPNFAGLVMIGLGCEVMQLEALGTFRDLRDSGMLKLMNVQEEGGTGASVEAGVAHVRKMLPVADQASRQPTPVDRLVVGLECGGSDAYSGISANPALGAAADLLVQQGGTVILGETPEIYGAEHLLTRRAVSPEVAGKLVERIRWWERYTARHGGEMDNNPTPGNKAGGLTTIFEKSLGAVAKAGSTDLIDVYRYAQPVTAKGLVFMDTPGYDPVSLTGMVAGGANLICFTTGRGSVYGCRPVPSLKLATHTPMYERLEADMDIDCGAILNGGTTVAEMGRRIFETILSTASGQRTKSEMLGIGNDEFVPWQIGAVM